MRRRVFALALAAFLGGIATAGAADDDAASCMIALEHAPAKAPRFEDYPAQAETVRPVPVDLKGNAEARRFRTMLRDGAAEGPNFAGHYTIVGWGCGAACLSWAVVDATTGKVHFDPATKLVSAAHVSVDEDDGNVLRFRRDSRLLIVLGAPHEDETREGITYLLWDGKAFKRAAFVPYATLCGGKKAG